MGLLSNAGDRARRHGAGLFAYAVITATVAGLGLGWLTADAGDPPLSLLADSERAAPAAEAAPSPDDDRLGAAERARTTAALASTGGIGRLTVVADGREREVAAVDDTVADLLERVGVELDGDDRVDPDLEHRLSDGDRVVVERVERLQREREVTIAADEREEATAALPRGERRTVQQARPGLVVITEEITRVDGETVEREEIDRETAREPRDTVIEVGTAEPEPEAATASAQPSSGGSGAQPSSGGSGAQPSSGGSGGHGDPGDPATWDRLAQCEAGGDWQANTGNGYYGGLQFLPETWRSVGGTGMPHEHPRETQIEMGQRLHAQQGWQPWPHCSRQLGYR